MERISVDLPAVGADEAVALATLELEARVVQQDTVAVGERELLGGARP